MRYFLVDRYLKNTQPDGQGCDTPSLFEARNLTGGIICNCANPDRQAVVLIKWTTWRHIAQGRNRTALKAAALAQSARGDMTKG